jgi:SAM-dependent methyltransferase
MPRCATLCKGRVSKYSLLGTHDDYFDCVACAFGLLHMERPESAIAEAHRVLRHGGRFTFTVWCSPAQGGDFFALILGAGQTHGTLDVALPPAPPFFRFADPDECRRVLTAAQFITPTVSTIPLTWHGVTPRDVLDLIYRSTVRTRMVLEAQTAEARERIHEAILTGAAKYRVGDGIAMALPAVMATATKACTGTSSTHRTTQPPGRVPALVEKRKGAFFR